MKNALSLATFLLLVLGGGLVIGFLTAPGEWYAQLALAIILVLLAAILSFMVTAWRQHRVASWMFAPYAAWVAFASVLNGSILVLN